MSPIESLTTEGILTAFLAGAVAGAFFVARAAVTRTRRKPEPPRPRLVEVPPAPSWNPEALTPRQVAAISIQAERDARIDHALGIPHRSNPHERHTRACVVWATAYCAIREELAHKALEPSA